VISRFFAQKQKFLNNNQNSDKNLFPETFGQKSVLEKKFKEHLGQKIPKKKSKPRKKI